MLCSRGRKRTNRGNEHGPLLQTENANVGQESISRQAGDRVAAEPAQRVQLRTAELFRQQSGPAAKPSRLGGEPRGTADQDVSFFNFGGGFFGTTAFLLDGNWDASAGWGGVIYVPSPDNVQEFKVQQNSFTSQYGWSTGNVINVITKSGGNNLHGDVYDYLRNGKLDANYLLQRHQRPAEAEFAPQSIWGLLSAVRYTYSGVYKQRDKDVLLFNYEGHRENDLHPPAFRRCTYRRLPQRRFLRLYSGSSIGTDAGQADSQWRDLLTLSVHARLPPGAGPNWSRMHLTATSTGFIRDPIAGNNVANAIPRHQPDRSDAGQLLPCNHQQPIDE